MRIYGDRVRTSKSVFVSTSPPWGGTRGGRAAIKAGRRPESSVVVQATFHPSNGREGRRQRNTDDIRGALVTDRVKQRIFICSAKRERKERARKPDFDTARALARGQFSSRLLISDKNNLVYSRRGYSREFYPVNVLIARALTAGCCRQATQFRYRSNSQRSRDGGHCSP